MLCRKFPRRRLSIMVIAIGGETNTLIGDQAYEMLFGEFEAGALRKMTSQGIHTLFYLENKRLDLSVVTL